MTDDEVVAEMRSGSLRAQVRQLISAAAGKLEQASAQRRRPTICDIRRIEFEAADQIINLVRDTPDE